MYVPVDSGQSGLRCRGLRSQIQQMYTSTITVVALLAALPTAFGSPTLQVRQNGVTCQTSSDSPVMADITMVINELRGKGGFCYQSNGQAADCTTLVKHGDASISVCGGVDDDKSASLCSDLAGFANQIQQTCMSGASGSAETFAGGTYTISPSKRVEVINSGGKIVE